MAATLNDLNEGAMGLLLSRRSGSAKTMGEPGPSASQLQTMLEAASRAPDHGKLFPWRFIVIEGDARTKLGQFLATALSPGETTPERVTLEQQRFLRAPVVVAVVSRVREAIHIPEWEQILSSGAVCQNLLLAAHAHGFVANWITEWCAYHPKVKDRLGLRSGERIAGFVYIGSSTAPLEERARPDLGLFVTRFRG
jgi:nitroreductase